jgi:manganese-dependent ADP-ribose/CDP-alcohol diphosphatase
MSDLTKRKPNRRSQRIQKIARRSSSLGEESDTNRFHANDKDQKYPSTKPLLTFGVIADIQYAPIPDGYSYTGNPRYYRHALDVASHAAKHFEQEKVSLVLNLGDIVDGKCQSIAKHGGEPLPEGVDPGHKSVDDVVQALSRYKHGPIIHVYGNHCLYNVDRPTLQSKLGIPFVKEPCGDLVGYWSHVQNGVRFVVLDSYDINKMQRCNSTSQKHKEANDILSKNNPNYPENENSPEGLVGVAKRFVAFNGGVGSVQLEWLRNTLQRARDNGEKVVVLSHQPIHPQSTSPVCLVWNYKEVLAALREYKDVVLASFSGHAHKGGYQRDISGIHFRVLEAALESPDPDKTYAMVDMYDHYMEVRGFGSCKSAIYDY